MASLTGGRPYFREWVDGKPDPGWPLMPLNHISNGIGAQDIIRAGRVGATQCPIFNEPLAYFFYGRPAYRISSSGSVKVEAACPYCFVFSDALIGIAKAIFAFDTGAFDKRLLEHFMIDGMEIADYSLECDAQRPNRLIRAVFSDMKTYLEGDVTKIAPPEQTSGTWDFHARTYLHLLASRGRNEPDDRICSIEVVFGTHVPLAGNVKAVIVPHTLWDQTAKAPWLQTLGSSGVEIVPYEFLPGRHPEHYHAQLEAEVGQLYASWGLV